MAVSKEPLANITPVTPPIVNKKTKPIAYNIGTVKFNLPPNIVANQLKILTPVGNAIVIVAPVKYALESTSIPTVNI